MNLAVGDEGAALPSLIASLLLPDLPVFLLLRLDPERWEPLVRECWSFATRVVVDSTGERSGLHVLPALIAREPTRSVTDLSWTKLTGWRELVARLFDPPKAARALARLDRIEITHAGRSQAQARLLAAWVLSRTGRHPSVELTSQARRDMRSGSIVSVTLTCGKDRYEVLRLAEGVAEVRSPHLEPQQARLWVPHLPALIAEELGIYERDEGFEAAAAQLAPMNLDVSPDKDAAIDRVCALIAGAAPRSLVLTGRHDCRRRLRAARVRRPGATASTGRRSRSTSATSDACRPTTRAPATAWPPRRCSPASSRRPSSACAARSPTATPRPRATRRCCPPRFDVTLLSMGEDGHCASLFPGSPQLAERERLCTTGVASYAPYERITLTLPALDRSALVLILALGDKKHDALARIRAGEPLPSAQVAPVDGEVVWIVDEAALGG